MKSGRFLFSPEGNLKGPGQERGQYMAQHSFRVMGALYGAQFAQMKMDVAILTFHMWISYSLPFTLDEKLIFDIVYETQFWFPPWLINRLLGLMFLSWRVYCLCNCGLWEYLKSSFFHRSYSPFGIGYIDCR